jgi:hypothetical protein
MADIYLFAFYEIHVVSCVVRNKTKEEHCSLSSINHYELIINPLTATDVYIRQIWLFPQRIQNMSFIFIVVLRIWKSLTPKDVMAVNGLKWSWRFQWTPFQYY